MKVYLKVSTPNLLNFLNKEFIIEDDTSPMTFMTLIQKLKIYNSDLYHELSSKNKINSNYICIVNNELLLNNEKECFSLNDGDKVAISFAIGGG